MWPTEKGALYSVIIVDVNIERVLPKGYFHWAVINIPGNRIEDGNEVRLRFCSGTLYSNPS